MPRGDQNGGGPVRPVRGAVVVCLLASASAHAAPCAVSVERAPDAVRAAIDAWVAREAACRAAIAVWADPVDGGFALTSRDERGRIRTRTVPDADTAGVLVASWAADDAVEVGPAPVRSAMFAAPAVEVVVRYPPPEPHWIVLGPDVSAGGSMTAVGPRGQIDFIARGPWAFGLAAVFARGLDSRTTMTGAALYGMYAVPIGPVRVRTQVGVGGTVWKGELADMSYTGGGQTAELYLRGEASVLVGVPLARRWQALAGPAVVHDQVTRASLYVGVGYRL